MITASVASLVDSRHSRVGSRLRLRRCSSTSSLTSATRPVPGSDNRTDNADDSSDDECIPITSDVFLEGDEGRRDPVPVPESVPLLLRMHMWIFQYHREKGRSKQSDVGSSRGCSPTTPLSSKPFTDKPESSVTTTMEKAVVDHTRELHASHSLPPYQQPSPPHQQPPPSHQQPPLSHQQPPPPHQQQPPSHQQPPPPHQQQPPSHQQPPPPHQQPLPPHQQPLPPHQQPLPPKQKPPPSHQRPPPSHQQPPPFHQQPPPSHQQPPPFHQQPPPSHQETLPPHQKPPSIQQPPSDQLPTPHQQEQTEFHQRATVQQQPPQSQQTSQEQTGLSQQPVAHSQTETKENVFWCGIDGSDSTPLRSKPPLSRKPSKKEKKEVIRSNQRETEQPKDNHQEWRLSEHGFDDNDKENDRHFGSHLEEETEDGSYGMRRNQDLVTISQDLSFGRSRGVRKVHEEASSTRGRAIEVPPKSHQTPSSAKGTQPQHKRHQHPHSGKSDESHKSVRKRNDREQRRRGDEKKHLTVNQTSEKQTVSDQSKNPWSHNGPNCYIAPKANSNKKLIRNAVSVVCLAGSANIDKRVSALQELDEKGGNHCLILFKDNAGSIKFKALYNYFPEEDEARRIYGIGPKAVLSHMAAKFYKYNSGKRDFEEVATKTLSIRISGFTLKSSHQKK